MNESVVISVDRLTKVYRLYKSPVDRLKESLHPFRKKYHHKFYALDNVSFSIKKGETVGIIGKNGSGKSTLLQIITGVLTPTAGNVNVNGRIAALLELGAGFNPEISGIENIYFSGALMGFNRSQIDERINDITKFADIGDFIHQPVKTYSSGMFLRLAFAVNIMSDPEVMIVDEALAVGDMNFQAKCITALKKIQERGATILFVSHDLSALKSLCTRGIYLENGKLKSIGPAGEVAEEYICVMREEMNTEFGENKSISDDSENEINHDLKEENASLFKRSIEFERKVSLFRYGTGTAKITFAELLDDEEKPINYIEFNQIVSVIIFFESLVNATISCNYYILDEKKRYILGSGLALSGKSLIEAKKGSKHIVKYKTSIPLHEGNYSIQLQLTKPIVLGETAEFMDVIDDAVIFKVERRKDCRLWAQVYVKNEVEIHTL